MVFKNPPKPRQPGLTRVVEQCQTMLGTLAILLSNMLRTLVPQSGYLRTFAWNTYLVFLVCLYVCVYTYIYIYIYTYIHTYTHMYTHIECAHRAHPYIGSIQHTPHIPLYSPVLYRGKCSSLGHRHKRHILVNTFNPMNVTLGCIAGRKVIERW